MKMNNKCNATQKRRRRRHRARLVGLARLLQSHRRGPHMWTIRSSVVGFVDRGADEGRRGEK